MSSSVLLSLKNVQVSYENTTIIEDISLDIEQGELLCLLGHSGCGKTTILRAIAGFEPIGAGEIWLNSQQISAKNTHLPAHERAIGIVFQDYALFPHCTVEENIAFGLHRWLPADKKQRVAQLLALIDLEKYAKRYPHELSGGQQQRIALARALAPRPAVLLLDEPFSNLDVDLRERLSQDVRTILQQENVTGILVTHDQNEAFAIADRVALLNRGHLEQCASPYQLYHAPASVFVANFIGKGAFLAAKRKDDRVYFDCAPSVFLPLSCDDTKLPALQHGAEALQVFLRPDDLCIDDSSPLQSKIIERNFRGDVFLYKLLLENGETLFATMNTHEEYAIGAQVRIRINPHHLIAFPA